MRSMTPVVLALVFGILTATSALAAYPEDGETADIGDLKQQIEGGRADEAETSLKQLLSEAPNDPDILNLLGYANRKMGRFDLSRDYYDRALAIDPVHKGALEYKGELELQTGHVDAAKELLHRLREQCPTGCEELDDLLNAFADKGIEMSTSVTFQPQ